MAREKLWTAASSRDLPKLILEINEAGKFLEKKDIEYIIEKGLWEIIDINGSGKRPDGFSIVYYVLSVIDSLKNKDITLSPVRCKQIISKALMLAGLYDSVSSIFTKIKRLKKNEFVFDDKDFSNLVIPGVAFRQYKANIY